MKFKEYWKRFCTLNRRQDGFTLVELIVVIAILAILATVAVPAYSGYVEKARKAADEQLLSAVNTAFAAACIENGVDSTSLADGSVTFSTSTMLPSKYDTEFQTYFAGNSSARFDVIEQLLFVSGKFVDPLNAGDSVVSVDLPGGGKLYVTPAQLALLQSSTYSKDIGGLMTQIDGVAVLVTGLLDEDPNNPMAAAILGEFVGSEEYLKSMITALGGDVKADDLMTEYGNVLNNLVNDQVRNQLAAELGMDPEDVDISKAEYSDRVDALTSTIRGEVSQNLLVLGIAQNAAGQSSSSVMDIINSSNPKDKLLEAMGAKGTAGNSGNGMGSAALVYGAFTAYANSASATDEAKAALANKTDPTAVFDILEDPDELAKFQSYMNSDSGKNDLNACISAMDMIQNTSSDKDAVAGILTNGYANDDFVEMLEGLLGTGTNG